MSNDIEQRYEILNNTNKELEERVIELSNTNNQLNRREKYLTSLFKNLADGLVSASSDGTVIDANPAFESIFGYTRKELIGSNALMLLPEGERRKHSKNIKNYIEHSEDNTYGFGLLTKGRRKYGSEFAMEFLVGKSKDANDQTIFTGIVRDVSERIETMRLLSVEVSARKKAQEELNNVNKTLKHQLSVGTNELRRIYILSSIMAHPDKSLEEIFDSIITDVLANWSFEHRTSARIKYDGKIYQTDNFIESTHRNSASIFIKNNPIGLIEIFYLDIDLSEINDGTQKSEMRLLDKISQNISSSIVHRLEIENTKKMEVQLRQAQKLESVGQLASGIAHEINTPTQFVNDNTHFLQEAFSGYSKLLTAYDELATSVARGSIPETILQDIKAMAKDIDIDYLSEEIPLAIEQSMEGLQRIAKIVNAMKDFSHPGSQRRIHSDINKAIEMTVDVCRNEWKYVADLITELDPELPQIPVLIDEFNQVILNLIVNSAHAISDKAHHYDYRGKIRIITRQENNWAIVEIIDDGCGIPDDIKFRIFDPFFTTKDVGKGSGQGLAIAWSVIVDKHQGYLDLQSQDKIGSHFTIRLPIG